MILYSWNRIVKRAKSVSEIIEVFKHFIYEEKKLFGKYSQKDFSGYSFLLNPKVVLRGDVKPYDIVEYLKLSSLRNTAEFYLENKIHLPTDVISFDIQPTNPLLHREPTKINFKGEQAWLLDLHKQKQRQKQKDELKNAFNIK